MIKLHGYSLQNVHLDLISWSFWRNRRSTHNNIVLIYIQLTLEKHNIMEKNHTKECIRYCMYNCTCWFHELLTTIDRLWKNHLWVQHVLFSPICYISKILWNIASLDCHTGVHWHALWYQWSILDHLILHQN